MSFSLKDKKGDKSTKRMALISVVQSKYNKAILQNNLKQKPNQVCD